MTHATDVFTGLNDPKPDMDELKCQVIREHLQKTINQILLIELNEFIGYDPHDTKGYNSGDSRNGFYTRKLKTPFGEIKVRIPRDRNGKFHQKMIAPYTRILDLWSRIVLCLYARNNTSEDIVHLLEEMYNDAYDEQTISNIANRLQDCIGQFYSLEFEPVCPCLYAVSIPLESHLELLADCSIQFLIIEDADHNYQIAEMRKSMRRSQEGFDLMMEDLKSRGVEHIEHFRTDLPELSKDCVLDRFPAARFETVGA